MQILTRLKQLGTSLLHWWRTRSGRDRNRDSATAAAEELWYEGQHETAPIGHSDTGTTDEPRATPERRKTAK